MHLISYAQQVFRLTLSADLSECLPFYPATTRSMLKADEEYFKVNGEPLFSSHMLDLSEETNEENIGTCAEYLKKMAPMKIILEMEIGITGGVEDGVNNEGVSNDKLYSTESDIEQVHKALSPISPMFTIAAAFGNVHGVYKAGNVTLQPELLGNFQKHGVEKMGLSGPTPFYFVFHGGPPALRARRRSPTYRALSVPVVAIGEVTFCAWSVPNGRWFWIHQGRDCDRIGQWRCQDEH